MGNMEGLVTLVFFKIESKNFVSWGILMQIFQKVMYFQIQSFYDVIIGIIQGPVTLLFLTVEAQNLAKLGYFDMFSKASVLHKYCFIC